MYAYAVRITLFGLTCLVGMAGGAQAQPSSERMTQVIDHLIQCYNTTDSIFYARYFSNQMHAKNPLREVGQDLRSSLD